jgi:ATP-binding cassette subfamily B multidrug efflux pump
LVKGIRSILAIFIEHRKRVALGILCLLAVDAGQLAIPLVVREVLDGLVAGGITGPWIARQALILLGLAFIIAVFRFAWRHFFFSTARLAELDLRNRILRHALSLKTPYFTQARTGEFMALATNDVESVREAVAMGFVAGFDASIFSVVAIAAMFWLDSSLAVVTILPLFMLAVLMAVSLKAIYTRWDAVQAAFQDLTEKTRESVAGMRVLRAYVCEDEDAADFERRNQDYFRTYMHYVRIDAFFHPAILLLAGVCVAVLLGVGGGRVIEGRVSVGSFAAFASYLGMLAWPMIAAGWMTSLVPRAAASMDRIGTLLDVRDVEVTGGPELPPMTAPGEVEARFLTFTYPQRTEPALRGLSFRLLPGSTLGVIGETGSGKSTIAQLVSRIYEPPRGALFIDGRDVLDVPLSELRCMIAYVPQEAFLFSDTITENLRIGNPEATREQIEEACRLAALDREIEEFPKGYETLLGERGITLSGGQKQRLCLARAILKKASLLVLDDTLSAVDAETEQEVLAALRRVRGARTLVVISHRVSAVKDLDGILCLRRGEVIQAGTHETLSGVSGFYRDMVALQEMAA